MTGDVHQTTVVSPRAVPAAVFERSFHWENPLEGVKVEGQDHHLRISADGYRHSIQYIGAKRRLKVKYTL